MKLFLDTANVKDIQRAFDSGLLDGVTTNPSLAFKEGRDFNEVVKEILNIFKGTDKIVNLEVISTRTKDMVLEARKLATKSKNVVVKVPMIPDGLLAVKELSKHKIRTNVTLCFSPSQALLAAKAGAYIISPFIGRIDDHSGQGMEVVKEIRTIYNNYSLKTQILVASIRSPRQVTESALIGADIATMPYDIFEKLFKHPLTDSGLKKFLDDWQELQDSKKWKH